MKKILYKIMNIRYGENIHIEDLDLKLADEIFGKSSDCHEYETRRNLKYEGSFESDPIKINQVISILGEFKKKGFERVEIEVNTDHHAYIFYPVKVKSASKTSKNNIK